MKEQPLTNEIMEKIKMLNELGLQQKQIAQIMDLSTISIRRVVTGTRDKHIGKEKLLRELGKACQEWRNGEPNQTTMNAFSESNLQARIADSIDYNNALMNGILGKLDKLLAALGV